METALPRTKRLRPDLHRRAAEAVRPKKAAGIALEEFAASPYLMTSRRRSTKTSSWERPHSWAGHLTGVRVLRWSSFTADIHDRQGPRDPTPRRLLALRLPRGRHQLAVFWRARHGGG